MSLLDQIREKSKIAFRPADHDVLQKVASLGLPRDALSFYADSAPSRTAQIADVRLCPLTDIWSENTDYVPGYYARLCGYVVFATTICGDAYCFDTHVAAFPSTAPIVLIAHDLEPEDDVMKREDLTKLAKPIAPLFHEFLQAFVSETLDTKPLYRPFNFGNAGEQTPQ